MQLYNNKQRTSQDIQYEIKQDLQYLSYIYGDLQQLIQNKPINVSSSNQQDSNDIIKYYNQTTLRDYKLMELYIGNGGMHTLLKQPKHIDVKNLAQAAMILSTLNTYRYNKQIKQSKKQSVNSPTSSQQQHQHSVVDSQLRVLELGSGKGINLQFIAYNTYNNVQCIGIDLVDIHTQVANYDVERNNIQNCKFYTADYTRLLDQQYIQQHTKLTNNILQQHTYDCIYAIESLCHIGNKQQKQNILKAVEYLLKPKGMFIVIDAYKIHQFHTLNQPSQLVMKLAEYGYRCQDMSSKYAWIELCNQYKLSHNIDIDLTEQAISFWQEGRIGVRFLLYFWPLLRLIRPYIGDTQYNFLAMSTTAYTLECNAAEYGMIGFVKPNLQHNNKQLQNGDKLHTIA